MARVNAARINGAEEFGASKRRVWGITAVFAIVTCGGAVLSGCAGLANSSNANPTPQGAVEISPSDITFPNVAVGQKATQTAVLTNTGKETVTITQLASSAAEFAASGLSTPLAIGPGQSAKFQVVFHSSTSGSATGTLTAMTSHGGSSHVKLKGSGSSSASQLSLSTTALNFGNVLVNGNVTQAVTLKNSGGSDLQITQIGVTGGAFSVSGVAAPVTISAGQSMALQATFAPKTAGAASGAISIASNATNPTSTVTLNGSAVTASYTMSLSPTSLDFGNVAAGSSTTQNVQLSNTGNSSVTVTQVAASGAGISVSGLLAPVTLAPSQSLTLSVRFAPTVAGTTSGSVTVTNNDGVNAVAAVTGTQVQPGLSLTPTSASFGSVTTGTKISQTIQIKNSGTANLTISQATVTGAGFSANGMTLPLTLTPGQSGSLIVQYAPQAAGSVNGLISILSNAPNSPATVALSGTGMATTSAMSLSPTSVNFGNVNAGSSATQSVQLSNTGNSSVTVTQVAASGTGISVSGVTLPLTLAPSQSIALSVTFAPTTAGTTAGSLTVTNSNGGNAVAALTGTQVQSGLTVTPASASFGSVVTGNTNSQTVQIRNSGTANLTVSQATVTGAGFSLSGMPLPMTLTPGQSGNFTVQYTPQSTGSVSGAVSIISNAPNSPATVALSATGMAASYTISVNPGSLSFGSVTDGTAAAQGFTVTNTGNSNVAISGITATGTGYSLLSGAGAVTLSPNQSTAVSVQFAPSVAGAVNGSVKIMSNATGSASGVALSGTGVAPAVQHSVALNWGASSTSVAGYNVYRSTVSGSSYAKVNGSVLGGVSYADSSVQSGQTYYYVATAVDSSGIESVYSNEVSAIVP
jgi:Abnormal spindle-like microcephaly-assoc'd, ASPM-SPD-2-Hydin/Transmembrane protein 131-like N-terminal/Protein of unknown function (DUF1573)